MLSINCYGQLVITDSVKSIKTTDEKGKHKIIICKISYAVNKTDDTLQYMPYDNKGNVLVESIISVPPHSTSMIGFASNTVVNKIQAKKSDDIVRELKKQKIKFDSTKIKSK